MHKTLTKGSTSAKIRAMKKIHRWLMLFVGLQFLVWSLTGVYMVLPSIHYIHGDHWVNTHSATLNPNDINFPLSELLINYPQAQEISLVKLGKQSVYRFSSSNQKLMLNAETGEIIPPLNKSEVIKLLPYLINLGSEQNLQSQSLHLDSIQESIVDVQLITHNAASEIGSSALPLWRINLDTWDKVSLYVSAQSGELVKVRHDPWRVFDWMWRFHIMDYNNGENISNYLLAIVSIVAFLSALAGLYLLYLRFLPKRKLANGLANHGGKKHGGKKHD